MTKKETLLYYARRGDEIPCEKFHCSKLQDPEGGQWSVVTQVELILTRIFTEESPYIFYRVGHIILLSFLLIGPKSDFNLVYQSYSVVLLCLRGQHLNTICECNVYLTTGNQLELSSYSVVGIIIIFSGICLRSQHLNTICVCIFDHWGTNWKLHWWATGHYYAGRSKFVCSEYYTAFREQPK